MTMPIKMCLSLFKCSQKDPKKLQINKINRKLFLISKFKEKIKIIKDLPQFKMEEEDQEEEDQEEEDQEEEEAFKINKWTKY